MGDEQKALTGAQEKVLVAMLAGETQRAAARAAGVAPETVSRWMSGDALFVATLNQRRKDLWAANGAKLAELGAEAIGVLAELMQKGDSHSVRLRAAVAVLRAQTVPGGETDAERIRSEWSRQAMFDALSSWS